MGHKVLFISSWYPNPQNKTLGIFIKRAAEAVSLHNKVAVIYVHGHESFQDEFKIEAKEDNGIYEVYVFYKKKKRNPLTKFLNYRNFYLKGLDHLLQHWGKPDIIHLNVLFPSGIAAMAISKKIKVPYIACENWTGYHPEDGNYFGFFRKYFTKLTAKKAAAIVTVSEHLKNGMLSHNLKGNYKIIPNVVNTAFFRCDPHLNESKFRFLHVSSLDARQKNVEGLIDVFTKLHEKTNNAIELVIIGDGENRKALEKRCGKLLNSSIFFEGQKFDDSLANAFNKAHCFVLFSNYENLPVVVLESICCGTPVIISNVGGTYEYMNEDLGYLVPAKNNEELSKAMQKMIYENKSFDRKKISRYGEENFSYKRVSELFTALYDEVLN